ncbi:MAG: glycosyltransferase family 39 protein [bacterium]
MKDRTGIWLLFVIAVAILLRVGFTVALAPTITGDSGSYIREAKAFLTEESLDADPTARRRPPGYPLFLAVLFSVSMKNYFLVVLAQHLMGLAVVVMVFYICRVLTAKRSVALVAAFLVSADLYILFYEHAVLSDFLQMFFITTGIFNVALYVNKKSVRFLSLAGLIHGLLALTKTVFYLYCAVPAAALLLPGFKDVKRGKFRGVAAYLVPFLVLLVAWSVIRASVQGSPKVGSDIGRSIMVNTEFFIDHDSPKHAELKKVFREYEPLRSDNGGEHAFIELMVFDEYRDRTGLTNDELDGMFFEVAMEAIERYPWKYIGRVARELYVMFFPEVERDTRSLDYVDGDVVRKSSGKVMLAKNAYRQMNKILVIFFLVGLILYPMREEDRSRMVLYFAMVLSVCYVFFVSCALNWGLIRYRLAVEPIIMIFSAIAVCGAAESIAARFRKVEAG